MNEELLKSYEELKRNRNIINKIEPDFFFEIVDCLLKENEELKNDYENLNNSVVVKNYYIENSIPVQKVKDNIKKLEIKKEKARGERNIWERFAIEKSINNLQELLYGRNK